MELLNKADFSFYFLMLLCVYVFIKGRRLHKGDWINPLSATVLLTIGVFTVVSYFTVLAFVEPDANAGEYFGNVLWTSSVYLFAIYVGYSLRENPARLFIYRLLSIFNSRQEPKNTSVNLIVALLMGAALSYVALMVTSGVGLLWITDTRTAYQLHRAGVGHWWLIYQWLLMAAFVMTLFLRRNEPLSYLRLFLYTSIFAILSYFSGSKAAVLAVLVIAILYLHYFVRKISLAMASLAVLSAIILFFTHLVTSGVYESAGAAVAYFVDYFYVTAEFFSRMDEIGHRFGEGWLTSFWFYVPRAVFPDKPFEYGVVLINQVLFPGMAEQGATPGIEPWALSYLDFGVIGVAFEGFLIGSFQRAVYMRFMAQKNNIAMFIIFISACYIPVLAYATPILYLTIALFLGVLNDGLGFKQLKQAEPV